MSLTGLAQIHSLAPANVCLICAKYVSVKWPTDSTATHYGGCLISTAHLGTVLCPKSQSVHDMPAAAASPIKCACPQGEPCL